MNKFILFYVLSLMALIGVSFIPVDTQASRDANSRSVNACERYFGYFESKHNIPSKLLRSVSIIESGKYDDRSGRMAPWPWTVNLNGKGYYFSSKKDAIVFVNKKLKQGYKSMDLGCMQINLKYHGHEFTSLSEMFEPRYNIAYSARFLKNNFEETSNWKKAVGRYHSGSNNRGSDYSRKVFAMWSELKSVKRAKVQYEVASAE